LIELTAAFDIREALQGVLNDYGAWTYGILFLIIFAETGLVVAPFLPGDSLLFTAGLFARPEKGGFNLFLLMGLLMAASFAGDNVNFWIGRWIGRRAFRNPDSKVFKRQYLEKTREFYERHGRKTIIIGRFVPIVRTFAPFVAGMDAMEYGRFVPASAVGAVVWVSVCVLSGYFFGRIPWVEQNFEIVILGVIGLSLVGIFVEFFRSRAGRRRATQEPES
jgi:membrane-associated protein